MMYLTLYQGRNIFSASVWPMREPKRAVPRVAITTRSQLRSRQSNVAKFGGQAFGLGSVLP